MKLFLLLRLTLYTLNATRVVAFGNQKKLDGRADNDCSVAHALGILEHLSMSGESFCTSLLHKPKGGTKTESVTVTTKVDCAVKTETRTDEATFTSIVYGKSTTLPQLTFASYTSTVLIPSGTSRPINKRDSPVTPSSLTTCCAPTLSAACSSLLAPTTTRQTTITTETRRECLTTITQTVTTTRHTTTKTIPFVVTPPPVSTPHTGVLTTTVPADCLSGPYAAPSGSANTPDGDLETFAQYPFQPGTAVECCVACHATQNCIASAFDPDSDECAFLVRVGSSSGIGVSNICPLGLQDYMFGQPVPGDEISPGPCGY